jgi:spoIIIJ-associated protein
MTSDREFYASTVEEAVAKAVEELGVGADKLGFKVLDEGNTGFLGIGARDARIAVQAQDAPLFGAQEEGPVVPSTAASSGAAVGSGVGTPSADAVERSTQADVSELGEEPVAGDVTDAPGELIDEVRVMVAAFLAAMDFEAGLDVYDAGRFIAVDVTPDNTALFIGQKGETIDALQYLVNVAMYKERPFVKRVVLDAEGYRQRRVEALQGMAHRTARRAVREQRAVELPPMSSSERRVVHLFLQDNPRVTTQSEGNGDNRRVKVSPVS